MENEICTSLGKIHVSYRVVNIQFQYCFSSKQGLNTSIRKSRNVNVLRREIFVKVYEKKGRPGTTRKY